MANNRLANNASSGGGVTGSTGSTGVGASSSNATAAANQMNEHVEFTVKADEDLYLTGASSTIRRVVAGTNYSCLMLKTQRFSSLFRHYAKYHGLRKDDLEYNFVNPLDNEDTPESVQLQRNDTINVRKRRPVDSEERSGSVSIPSGTDYFTAMRNLLDNGEHTDMIFVVGTTAIRAHRCILAARGIFFKEEFRREIASPQEGSEGRIEVGDEVSEGVVRAVLEFVYCNRVPGIVNFTVDELLDLLSLADRWSFRDLKRLVEFELMCLIDVRNVARMYCATEEHSAKRLANACISFIMDNIREVTGDTSFRKEMGRYPHLCIPVLKAAADLILDGTGGGSKRQRTGEGGVGASSVMSDT